MDKSIQQQIDNNVGKSVMATIKSHGVNMGVSDYVVANYSSMASASAITWMVKAMPWTANPIEFAKVIKLVETSIISTILSAKDGIDVSMNALKVYAASDVMIDAWTRVIVRSIMDADSTLSVRDARSIFAKQVGAQPASSRAKAAFIYFRYQVASGESGNAFSTSTIDKIVEVVAGYMIEQSIIVGADTTALKNGGIDTAYTVNESIVDEAIAMSMDVRRNSMMSVESIGVKFPVITDWTQATNPKVSLQNSKVTAYAPIADVNDAKSMETIVSMLNKSNAIGLEIDHQFLDAMATIPESLWDTVKK